MTVVAGIDFGTASVRVSIVDSERGRLGLATAGYPTERDPADPDHAVQHHAHHLAALEAATAKALDGAGVDGRRIAALAVDATGSTMVPVDAALRPLGPYYLWSDHRARREAEEITAAAARLPALAYCGGSYSPEWGFAKLLHWLRHNPRDRGRFATAIEHCDMMVATLCGIVDLERLPRSICAMGHKWMWNAGLGGLPAQSALSAVDPLLDGVRERIGGRYATSAAVAGGLCAEWARRLGLREGIPIPFGALDAHWDAIGAGCRFGDVVNVIGTSSCIMALTDDPAAIPGVAGVVPGSIHPDHVGIEAGLAAAGDLFDAIARRAGTTVAVLAEACSGHAAGQTGLLRLAWDNGDRSVLADAGLSGVTIGWRLHHSAADELFAAMEGTAFHTRIILERMADFGTPIERVINGGGIPRRSPALNRIYANALGKPVLVPSADITSLGSAIFAFLAAGTFGSVEEAQAALCVPYRHVDPDPRAVDRYEDIFGAFREIYFRWPRFAATRLP